MLNKKLAGLLAATVLLLTGACGTTASKPDAAVAWKPFCKEVLSYKGVSDLEKEILADCTVSQRELDEVEQLDVRCMAGKDWDVQFMSTGQSTVTGSSSNPDPDNDDAQNKADNECDTETGLSSIQSIHFGERENPQNLTVDQRRQACYKQYKLPGADLSPSRFAELVDGKSYRPKTLAEFSCFISLKGIDASGLPRSELEAMMRNYHGSDTTTVTVPKQ